MCRKTIFALLAGSSLLAGCSSEPARVVPPTIPADAGQAAVSKFDADGDQAIGGAELDQVPSLKSAMRRFDRNRDNKISPEEIQARIQSWQSSKVGLLQANVKVLLNGRPLSGAEVRLMPEAFLGTSIQPAKGITDNEGRAALRTSDGPGVQLGLYRIEISKKSGSAESIPAKYNERTELGAEIAMDNPTIDDDWILKLTSP